MEPAYALHAVTPDSFRGEALLGGAGQEA